METIPAAALLFHREQMGHSDYCHRFFLVHQLDDEAHPSSPLSEPAFTAIE